MSFNTLINNYNQHEYIQNSISVFYFLCTRTDEYSLSYLSICFEKIIKLIISLLKNVIISIFQYVCVSLPILLCGFYILLILNPCKAEIKLHETL